MKDVEIIGMLKSYVQKSLVGVGALKGAPCKIQSITDGDGFHTVKFEWTDDAGTSHTSDMIVNDGSDIASITQDGATITVELSDGTSHDFIVPTLQGPKGDKGDKGDAGVGVPEGGTTGQVLVKKSSTDYDAEWDTPAGGGDMLKSVYDTDNDGKVDSAENADTVDGHSVAKDVPADAKFTDTVYDDTEIRGEIADKVDKVDGKGLSTNDYTDADKAKLAGVEADAEVNTIESITLNGTEVTPDANKNVALTVITKAVNDLVNYYLKSETYSKTEVDDIVTAIKNSRFEVVATLPTTEIKTNVIYLVPKNPTQTSNVKDEYINLDGTTSGWEKIGDTEIDLSDYVTTQALNTALSAYTTTSDLTTLLADKADKVSSATNGNFAGLDASGNLTDSGKKADDFATAEELADEAKTRAKLGAHNFVALNRSTYKPQYEANLSSITDQTEDSVTVTSIAADYAGLRLYNKIAPGEYIVSYDFESDDTSYVPAVSLYYSNSEMIPNGGNILKNTQRKITVLDSYDYVEIRLFITRASDAVIRTGTFKNLMFRLATDTDATYQLYAMTNRELTEQKFSYKDNGVLGAHNLLPNTATDIVDRGVTFRVNDNGSITVSGTPSADSGYAMVKICNIYTTELSGKSVILSGGSNVTAHCYIAIECFNSGGTRIWDKNVVTSEESFIIPADTTRIQCHVVATTGFSGSPTAIYPMLRLATDTDATYQPYAKTNQKLTKDVQPIPTMLNDLGAKNLVPVTYDSIKAALATSSIVLNDNNQAVKNGITLTVVLDSKGNVAKCNVNGTASADTYFRLWVTSAFNSFGSNPLNSILYPTKGNYTISSGTDSEDVAFVYQPNISDEYSGCYIRIDNGKTVNVDVYPMLRYASIADGTYVPYAKTNQQLTQDSVSWDDLSEVGAVNYLPNTATSQTIYGVAYTVNSDGSITVDGTATGGNASLVVNMTTYLKKGTYKLTGAPEGYKNTTRLSITRGAPSNVFDNGNGATFTLTEDATNALYVQAIVWEGKTVDNLTFYPMITVASYNGDYVPYAKTNRELTEKIDIVGNLFTTTTKVVDNITHGIATTVATLGNLPIGTYVVSGQFNSDSAMSGGGLVQFASSGVIQNGATCSTIINQGFKANAGLTGIFNVTNATNQINLQIYTANADLTVSSARLAAIRIA